jgi:hypothetical protein
MPPLVPERPAGSPSCQSSVPVTAALVHPAAPASKSAV